MKFRRYTSDDAEAVDEIYFRNNLGHNLPTVRNCLEIAVAEDDNGRIIGIGAFQLIPEYILVMDHQRSKREQVEALKGIMECGHTTARIHKFKEVYAFTEDLKFEDILKKHFGFTEAAKILRKEVD